MPDRKGLTPRFNPRTKRRNIRRPSSTFSLTPAALAYKKLIAEDGKTIVADDVLALQRTVGNQAVQRILVNAIQLKPRRQRRSIRGLPFYLPVGSDVLAAKTLIKYLVGSHSQKVTKQQKKRIVQRYLGGKSKRWMRGVETNYNHQKHDMYLVLNFKGTPYEYGHWQKARSQPTSESPFRKDLQSALGAQAAGYIAALEGALRLKPLAGREYALALLSPKQRQVATARAKGQQKTLAKWLFQEKTWSYLVINRSQWGPATKKGGFFDIPSSSQRGKWPKSQNDAGKGDELYLNQILHNLKQVVKQVDSLRQQVCAARLAGWIGGENASLAIQWAYSQEILEYRKNLRKLRKDTQPGLEKIIPIKLVWGPRPKNTSEVCKTK